MYINNKKNKNNILIDSKKNSTMNFINILIEKNKLKREDVETFIKHNNTVNEDIYKKLIEKSILKENDFIDILCNQIGYEYIDLNNIVVDMNAVKLISEKLARRINSIPIKVKDDEIFVAMQNPLNIYDIEDIKIESGKKVNVFVSKKEQIYDAIEKYMLTQSTEKAVEDFDKQNSLDDFINELDFVYDSNSKIVEAPVVRIVNSIIERAFKMNSSDIHIEPFEKSIRVRMRIDGELIELFKLPKNVQSAITTRIKIIADMDISESRLPQDGSFNMEINSQNIDLRVSSMPDIYGEKIVIRILNRNIFLKTRDEIGLLKENQNIIDEILKSSSGVLLLAGSTGTGKTTTLYALLNSINNINKNIITVEDPVEYKLEGINQVQINVKKGFGFVEAIRSILRQDPDIIMVGEIRDELTAEIAIRAAITGHLVISTIHTNNSVSGINRLKDMGVKPYLLSAAIKGIASQRLIKKICLNCVKSYKATLEEKKILDIDFKKDLKLYRGEGCNKCFHTGYKKRIAIYEILQINKEIKDAIYNEKSIDDIESMAKLNGMKTLTENCKRLVLDGITTIDEYLKVLLN